MFPLSALVTVLASLLYLVLSINVGRARGKYKIDAPATTGHPEFERIYRVQMNTLEQLVFFLPSLWLCTFYSGAPLLSAALGTIWLLGRVIYAKAYAAGKNRTLGFAVNMFAASALLLGGLIGVLRTLLSALA